MKIVGMGRIVPESGTIDVAPYLRDRKMAKFMSKQDKLALIAASLALRDSGLAGIELGDRCGVYFGMGTLPFEQAPLESLFANSVVGGKFSMDRFSTDAYRAMNPLLTFQCLPNMPVFHVSYNLGIQGPYFVTYPGMGAWFQALARAVSDLDHGRVEFALLGAVADQRNVLTRHHLKRIGISADQMDAACVWILSRADHLPARAVVTDLELQYQPADPWAACDPAPFARIPGYAGIVEPSLRVAMAADGTSEQMEFSTDDGVRARLGYRRAP